MQTTLPPFLADDLPTLVLPCAAFGRAAMLVLVLPVEVRSLLAAFWAWGAGAMTEAAISRT